MNMKQGNYMNFTDMTPEEMAFLQQATANLTESQTDYFYMVYSSKRKSAQEILIFTLLGFIVVAGVQRFALGQIGMGLLYLFTGGFCLIGTIVDLVNNKSLVLKYNKEMAYDSHRMALMTP
ncbi:TM2 domain-containing protein [Mucilaginibacter ginsenosidivorax]|uniref:TM2 domain-containing protein n=1 Tax=Mucilaginibacter ginsenosidivorax TaxID=862126 RepID=A0A5B8VYY8_9SPHI|nr:TM2 domain-containing protein [Mucilaginibacter ginsenosidivorax]QEC76860.1 TM2 domain-containing protein [Mucilaginibacter ginsenosidivorax]